jgi:ABC-type glycerol-3-phosphate transport system substrate-binding protein
MLTWFSLYLQELPADTAAAAMPTSRGTAFTWMDGWVWALANPQAERHPRTVELAEFLTTSDFLAAWTSAAGYLPPRISALESWREVSLQNLADRVIQSGQISPPNDVMAALGPALQQAALEVLTEQADPHSAAQEAVSKAGGG